MIKKFLLRILNPNRPPKKRVIAHHDHQVDPECMLYAARKVALRLQEEGYEAYIVGGAVRDALLGREPKDFDVATSARPEQIQPLFRRSRVIGRRFRLVHVPAGEHIIEVSTFRSQTPTAAVSESGRILHDNEYGSLEEDALRRDFTVNALYYNPKNQEIIDFLGGYSDLQRKTLRMIGSPEARYREDPVRIVRALRLSSKLQLSISPETEAPILPLSSLLQDVPAARMFDELIKCLMSGHAEATLTALKQHGVSHTVFPMLAQVLRSEQGERFVRLALQRTDERLRDGKPVSTGFLLACLFWPQVLVFWQNLMSEGLVPQEALFQAIDCLVAEQAHHWAVPKKISATMNEIWLMQPRFLQRSGARPFRLLEQPRFRAAYDFLALRAEVGEAETDLVAWWTEFQAADTTRQNAMLEKSPARKARRRRPNKRKTEAAPIVD